MLKMSSQVATVVNTYNVLSKIPTLTAGKLNLAGNKVTAKWSVRAIDKGKDVKYSSNYLLDSTLKVIDKSDFGTDVSTELLSAVSPSETYRAVIREEKNNGKVDKKQFLEVWSRGSLQHCIDLTTLDLHGDVYADSEFGGLEWSPDESAIVYVAERKIPKSEPYGKRKQDKAADAAPNGGDTPPAEGFQPFGFLYRQDWGEQLEGKISSVVVVCRLPSETITLLDHLPATDCPGQVTFSPDGMSVVGTAWRTEPRRLGLIFCTNRPSYIFSLTLDGEMSVISGEGLAVRSPRFSASGRLWWLQRQADGPHHACHQLVTRTPHSNEVTVAIDIVQVERSKDRKDSASNGAFYGMYCQALPQRCFSADGRVVFSTPSGTVVRSYVYDADGDKLWDISRSDTGSTRVLDVANDVIVASYSTMVLPSQLIVARLPAKGSERNIEWLEVSEPTAMPAAIAEATVLSYHINHEGSTDEVTDFTALYIAPKPETGKKRPLIVWPHGGPHSCFADAYSHEAALFVMLGFAVLQVNYRGSAGKGEKSLRILPGRCGVIDVTDCKLATDHVLRDQDLDAANVMLCGGSHGGFLVAHLSGQHPGMYSAVVCRNPVIDLASMQSCTDIGDWCSVEAGFPWRESGPVSEEELLSLRRCSPLAHAHRVSAPTALLLGARDKRVPPYQGLEWARRLTANGVPTKVYMYDDNHSLSSVPVEMDNLINTARWFLQHLYGTTTEY